MYRRKWKNIAALILAAAMTFGQGGVAPAAQTEAGQTAVEATAAAEETVAAASAEAAETETAAGAEAGGSAAGASDGNAAVTGETAAEGEETGSEAASEESGATEAAGEDTAAAEEDGTAASAEEASGAAAQETGGTADRSESTEAAGTEAASARESAGLFEEENTEQAQIEENQLAASGSPALTAAVEGYTPDYAGNSRKNTVWLKGSVANGTKLTLKAEISNLTPGSTVTFSWTNNIETTPAVQERDRAVGSDGTIAETFSATVSADVYAYFCNVEVKNGTSTDPIDTFTYVVKDPLVIDTKDQTIHIAPYNSADAKSGIAEMEVKGSSKIPSDTFTENPPYWHISKQYKSLTLETPDSNPGTFDTKATLAGIDDATTTVTCKVSSRFSPDAVYGQRIVTFTIDTANHRWSSWKVSGDATIWAEGTIERSCLDCSYKETQATARLTPAISGNMTYVPVQAGQSTDLYKVSLEEGDYIQKWESGDRSICTVSGRHSGACTIYAKKKGRTTVTATAASGLKITVSVRVQSTKVKTRAIKGLPESITLKKGQKQYLRAELYPLTSQYPLSYKSSDVTVVKVSSRGKIKGKGPGRCTITVTSGRKSVTIPVTVTGIDATRIYHVRSAYTLKKGGSRQLYVRLLPRSSTSKVTYRSSNRRVVRVSKDGKLTARRKGTATVTITAVNLESESVTKTIQITVR